MTINKYIPIDTFTYNRPDHFAATLLLTLFGIFITMLCLVFKYESYNHLEICDPMFYYGKPCRNVASNKILKNPKFLTVKKQYYDLVSKYNATTGEYEGVRERTVKDKQQLDDAEHNIQDNLDNNAQFGEDSINEIKKITTLSNLITSKYLGNLKELMVNIHKAPQSVIMSLRGLPEHLDQLKTQIQDSISDPLLSQYTSPLQKLYRSLTDIDEQTSTQDIELPSSSSPAPSPFT